MLWRVAVIFGCFIAIYDLPVGHGGTSPFAWTQYTVRSGQLGPSGRKFHAFGFDTQREFLVVFGGIGPNGTVLDDTWVLDVAAGRWYESTRNGLHRPEARYGSVFGMYNGQLIMAAGCDFKYCFDDVWSFHAGSFVWTRIQPDGFVRPRPRGHASGGLYPGGRYLIMSGGINLDGEYYSDAYSFDLSQNRWHQIERWQSVYDPSSPHPRALQSAAMVEQNTLLTFGGCVKHGSCPSADTWTYDWQMNKWRPLKKCAMARSHGSMALTSYNNVPYAVLYGGQTKSRQIIASTNKLKDSEVAIFDVKAGHWSIRLVEGPKHPGTRIGAVLATTGQALYLFGGEIDGRFPNDVFVLTGDPTSALSVPCGESFFTLIALHGLLMFMGFAVLLQFGGALAQYSTVIREPYSINWRYLHKAVQIWTLSFPIPGPDDHDGCLLFQILGLIFVMCAFICGVLIIPDGHYHFQSVHGTMGVCIFGLLLIQALLGFLYNYFLLIVNYLLPLAVLTLTYIRVGFELWGSQGIDEHRHDERVRTKRKVVKMMITVVSIFIIAWFPYHAYFTMFMEKFAEMNLEYALHIYLHMYFLAMSSTIFNPMIYCRLNTRFRIGFKYAFRWLPCVRITKEAYLESDLHRERFTSRTATTIRRRSDNRSPNGEAVSSTASPKRTPDPNRRRTISDVVWSQQFDNSSSPLSEKAELEVALLAKHRRSAGFGTIGGHRKRQLQRREMSVSSATDE